MPTLDGDGPVAKYFAINLRHAREARGLSQSDLAQRVKELGHPCTQATIWKLEQGHREPKLSETAAIGTALDLMTWTELVRKPDTFELLQSLDHWRRRALELAEKTRAAAAAQLKALDNLAYVTRQAMDAGLAAESMELRSGGWLELTPEATVLREALTARVASESEDDEAYRRIDQVEELEAQIMRGLETSGVPLATRPEDIEFVEPEPAGSGRHHDEPRSRS